MWLSPVGIPFLTRTAGAKRGGGGCQEFDANYQAWAMSGDESGIIPKLNNYLLKHGLVVTTPVIGPSWE